MQKPKALLDMELEGYTIFIEGESLGFSSSKTVIEDRGKIEKLLQELKNSKAEVVQYLKYERSRYKTMVSVDIETTGLNPLKSDIRLISWADENVSHVSESVEDVKEILIDKNIVKVFHNAIFDVSFLKMKGYEVINYSDTLIMSQILGTQRQSHSLAAVAERELGINLNKDLQKGSNWLGKITELHKEYSRKDAEVTYKVALKLIDRIMDKGLIEELRRNEKALAFSVKAKLDGIYFDKNAWAIRLNGYFKEKNEIQTEILGELNCKINLDSVDQLKKALRNRGINIDDTKDDTLAKIEDRHPIVKKIRMYRKLQKLVSSSGKKLIGYVDFDGRIRASWNTHGTITGRMSCSEPNIQQISKDIKPFFKAKEGHKLIGCDYSQIELRVAAEISGDKQMIEAFKSGEDLHIKTAKMIFGKEDITKEERQIAKTCNFGLIYGMSAAGLQTRLKQTCNLEVSLQQAEHFRERFFKVYKGIRTWQIKTSKKPNVRTLGGKKWSQNELSYLEKYNYPIQGTAAEGLKEAMAIAIDEIPDTWKVCAIVHDEIVIEVPEEDSDRAKLALERWMEEGMSRLISIVPIVAEAGIFDSWQKA